MQYWNIQTLYTDTSQFMCNNWNSRNFLIALNLMSKASAQKNIMDPWSAPYQNSNEYWCFAYNQKTSGSNFLQTSALCTFLTKCYTKGPLLKLEVPGWHYRSGDHSCGKQMVLWCKSCLCPHTWNTSSSLQSVPLFTECSPQTGKKSRNLK